MDAKLVVKGVKESAVQYLRAHIITGNFPPGYKLSELELSLQLGISRSPIREAFRLLENEKLVTSIPRKGSFVSGMSLENCKEIYQAREMIELFAIDVINWKNIRDLSMVAEAIRKATEMRILNKSELDQYDPFLRYKYHKTRSAFHIKLVEVSNNSLLTHFYNAILPNLARYQALINYESSPFEHQQILDLIQERKYEQAKVQLRSHIRKLHGGLKTILEQQDPFSNLATKNSTGAKTLRMSVYT